MARALRVAGIRIEPGQRARIDIPIARRYTRTDELFIPAHVIHGERPGPRLLVCAAIHGDEINGVEIVRRVLRRRSLERLRGSLIAVPVVNVFGFQHQSRYLPDRRDLNRSFPGSRRGSLAARLAWVFMRELAGVATHGIDLHTGTHHRSNLPQIRCSLGEPEEARLARAFAPPVILDAPVRPGSLREAASQRGVPLLVYDAGEALRFDEGCVRAGVRGVVEVMRALDMLPALKTPKPRPAPLEVTRSAWVRAPVAGVYRRKVKLGARVERGELLGVVADPLGEGESTILAPSAGLIIGLAKLPLVHEGDALFHLARVGAAPPA